MRQAAGALEACSGEGKGGQASAVSFAVSVLDPQLDGNGDAPREQLRRDQLMTFCLVLLGLLMISRYGLTWGTDGRGQGDRREERLQGGELRRNRIPLLLGLSSEGMGAQDMQDVAARIYQGRSRNRV